MISRGISLQLDFTPLPVSRTKGLHPECSIEAKRQDVSMARQRCQVLRLLQRSLRALTLASGLSLSFHIPPAHARHQEHNGFRINAGESWLFFAVFPRRHAHRQDHSLAR